MLIDVFNIDFVIIYADSMDTTSGFYFDGFVRAGVPFGTSIGDVETSYSASKVDGWVFW